MIVAHCVQAQLWNAGLYVTGCEQFSIGPYRHKVYDPLFSVELMGVDGLGLIDAMRLAASNCEPPEIRPKLWENVVLCGGGSLMTGLQLRIKAEVSRVLPCSENIGDAQPKLVGFLRIPDYFTVLKEKQYQKYSTWLGGEIVAKVKIMNDLVEHQNSVLISSFPFSLYLLMQRTTLAK